jgi:hypothetical protein
LSKEFGLGAFDPETVIVLVRAVDEALDRAKADDAFRISDEEACRSALARHILDAAREGERDMGKLVEAALLRIRL